MIEAFLAGVAVGLLIGTSLGAIIMGVCKGNER